MSWRHSHAPKNDRQREHVGNGFYLVNHNNATRLMLGCSAEGCGVHVMMGGDTGIAPALAVKKARKMGWRQKRSSWYCRDHQGSNHKPEEDIDMSKVLKLQQDNAVATEKARAAKRQAMMYLDDYFGGDGRWTEGHTDATCAETVGLSVDAVKQIREEFYGPLSPTVPPEVAALRKDIDDMIDTVKRYAAANEAMSRQIDALCTRLAKIEADYK